MIRKTRRQILTAGAAGLVGVACDRQLQANTRSPSNNIQPSNSANARPMTDSNLDYVEIINTVNQVGMNADLRDWTACRNCFADQVEVDYTSLVGGKPATIPADTLMKQWATSFEQSFKNTQHLIGSHAVTLNGDTATCVSQFQAHHVLLNPADSPFWRLGGIYHHALARSADGWRVTKIQMTARWEEGKRPSA